ncbi:hypothetical protein [Xenophilus sp. Marseille-Q4582]|uniref:hypothetical protein n=1 Tax=Xenophilus sp. Marseille-Q4582 TaxID=2866600 RepID=UPI001CE4169B|nr:hypothetical protein [Xenophilus sp. Marseille-Q4582]
MSKKYDVTAVTGKYTDRDGNEKSRYMTIGAIIETRNGPMLKLEGVPVGWDGWAYLNEPKEREGGQPQQRQQSKPQNRRQDADFEDPPF